MGLPDTGPCRERGWALKWPRRNKGIEFIRLIVPRSGRTLQKGLSSCQFGPVSVTSRAPFELPILSQSLIFSSGVIDDALRRSVLNKLPAAGIAIPFVLAVLAQLA